MNLKKHLVFCASVSVLALGAATHAAAQTATPTASSSTEVGAVVVTARKRNEQLKDVPETVVAISKVALQQKGIVSFDDLGRQTPGLIMTQRSNNSPDVVIRGLGSYGNVQGVGFYIDDAQNFTDQTMRLQDVDRVEILKGPQGTLYGGNSLGGAVRYIAKTPGFDYSGEIEGELGTHDWRDIYAAVNAPLVSDVLALRVSGYFNHDNGFITDTNLGGAATSAQEEYSVRAQLLYKPTDKFTALFTLRDRDLNGTAFDYMLMNAVNQPTYHTSLTFAPQQDLHVWAGVANLSYDFGFANLTSITSVTRQSIALDFDVDYTPTAKLRYQTVNAFPAAVYTQEVRLTSQHDKTFDWIVGLYAARYENTQLNPSPFNETVLGNVYAPYSSYWTHQTDLAVFGSADLHLGDWTLTGGLRINNTDYEAHQYVYATAKTGADASVKDTAPLPKVSVAYKTNFGANLYASVAEGYESGKVDPTVSPLHLYKAEQAWTYEIGAKGNLLDNTLYYELAGYYIFDYHKQMQTYVLNSLGAAVKTVDNIGSATSKGVEANVDWRPIHGLSLTGAVGYLDAVWGKDAVYDFVSVAGKAIPNAPRWTANLGSTYSFDVSGDMKVSLHGDGSYTSSFPWALSYMPISNINPAYWIVAGRVALSPQTDRWELSLRADNALNQKFLTEFIPAIYGPQQPNGTCSKCAIGLPGPEQRFILALDMKF